MLSLNVLGAIKTLVVLNVLTGRAFLKAFGRINAHDVMSLRRANVLSVFVSTSAALIGLGSRRLTGSVGRLVCQLSICMSESVFLCATSGAFASVVAVLFSVPTVSVSIYVCIHVGVGALGAYVSGITLRGTGRTCNRVHIRVTLGENSLVLSLFAGRTGIAYNSASQAAGAAYGCSRTPIMRGLVTVTGLTVIANRLVGTSSRTARAVLGRRMRSIVRTGLGVSSVSVRNVCIVVTASVALSLLTNRAGLGGVAGSAYPRMSKSITLGLLTGLACLRSFTSSVLPAVSESLAVRLLTGRTGLGGLAGSIYPAVTESVTLSCLTNRAGLGRFAGSVHPFVPLGIKGLLFNCITK